MKRLGHLLSAHRRGLIALAIAMAAGLLVAYGFYLAWPPLGFIVAGLSLGGLVLVDFERPGRVTR